MSIRTALLTAALPITKAIGKIHAPWTVKKTNSLFYLKIRSQMQPGDILLSQTRGDLSGLVIPGFWSHAAIVTHEDCIVEAVSPRIRIQDFRDFYFKKDYVALLRPTFATEQQRLESSLVAINLIGELYDYLLQPTSEAFTCSETIQYAYEQVVPDITFTKRKTLGEYTVIPQDYWDAVKKLDLISTNYQGKR